jgi:dienelactone hydrolase
MRLARPGLVFLLIAVLLTACSRLPIAGGSVDPGQPGPYGVGLAYRKLSGVLPNGQPHTVQADIWYPAADQGVGQGSHPGSTAVVGRAVAPGRPFPLIVFSAGFRTPTALYSSLIAHLVSHGFAVATPEHQDCLPPCDARALTIDGEQRALDVASVLDGLLALDDGDDPVFHRLVDPARVGVAGQSYGGWATLTVLEHDPRFRAGLAMTPSTLADPPPNPAIVSRPVMVMAGVLDAREPYAQVSGFFAAIPPAAPDHYLLAVQTVGHQFLDGCNQDSATTGCQASMPQDQLRALVNRLGTAFLLRYVADRPVTASQLGIGEQHAEYAVVSATDGTAPVIPTPRPLPRPDPPSSDLRGTVLLADDLRSPRGDHLPTGSGDPGRYSSGYVDGRYEIAVSRPGSQGEAIISGTYGDAAIAVDVALDDPTPDQYVQLACRIQGPAAQYRFGFRPVTGEYWLTRALAIPASVNPADTVRALMLPPGLLSPAVHLGSASNRAELSCHGTTIEGHINGETVATVQDNTFSSGQVWIAAGSTPSGTSGGSRVVGHFSNLAIVAQ